LKYLKKFFEIYEDEITDFVQIFYTLDNGGKVNIEDIEDKRISMLLGKILKHCGA